MCEIDIINRTEITEDKIIVLLKNRNNINSDNFNNDIITNNLRVVVIVIHYQR